MGCRPCSSFAAPPPKWKANKAQVEFLARKLGVKNSGIEIISGHTTGLKRIKVIGEGTETFVFQQLLIFMNGLEFQKGETSLFDH